MPFGSKWTKEEDEVLLSVAEERSLSWKGWPEVLPGRSKDAIRRRLRFLRTGKTYYTPVESSGIDGEIAAMLRRGMTTSEIDAELRLDEGTARKTLVKLWSIDKDGAK